ncbi:hypothetical protein SLS60_000914 [Paraconiothyrium brasiliense]|uniref:Uncharacterized protein n=1 Tax=Paraconiothyrium brasiliense TaxID=300254 RepID=A0ABR3S7L4_9PLEO
MFVQLFNKTHDEDNAARWPTDHTGIGDMTDRDFNDERLQKAIRYLVSEGSGDPIDLYITRIQAIDEHILQQLPVQGKSFDPSLYRLLRSLVREVQDDVQAINREESSLDSDSDSSIEALYKDMSTDNEVEIDGINVSAGPSIILDQDELAGTVVARTSASRPIIETKRALKSSKVRNNNDRMLFAANVRASIDDDVIEKCFLYGGPNNDPEVWYKEIPPILHIGDTPYMEKWESAKINSDLAEYWGRSPKKLQDPQQFERINIYDSGSQYKLPAVRPCAWADNEETHAKIQGLWPSILSAFNKGLQGTAAQQKDKSYAPRMVLPLVSDAFIKPYIKPNNASSGQNSEGRRTSEDKGNAGVAGIKAEFQKWFKNAGIAPHEGLHTRSQPSRWEPAARPRLPETNLKKFNSKREEAARRDKPETLSPRERAVLRTRAALATTPTPEMRATPRLSAGPTLVKRKPGRPPNKPLDPSYHPPRRQSQDVDSPTTPDRSALEAEIDALNDTGPTKRQHKRSQKVSKDPSYRPGQSPVTPTKRKRDENLNFTESSKKAKRSTGTKKKVPRLQPMSSSQERSLSRLRRQVQAKRPRLQRAQSKNPSASLPKTANLPTP